VEKFKPFVHTTTVLEYEKHRSNELKAEIVAAGIGRAKPRAIESGSKKVGTHGFLRIIKGFAVFVA
jgi:hypothetical protein